MHIHFYEYAFLSTLCIAVYFFVVHYVWIYFLSVGILYVCLGKIRQRSSGKLPVDDKAVIITGCDSGLGHNCAKHFDERGFTVFAGCLDPEGKGAKSLKSRTSERLHIVPLDVTKDESVQTAHDYVVKHMPKAGLWAIVNNAGIYVFGDFEWMTIGLYKKIYDVNFYGAVRTIRKFLYLVRRSKGRVVVVTSVRALFSWPGDSAYHATKFALETTLDSLRLEMIKFGVKVAKVQPGNFSDAALIRYNVKRHEQEAAEMWENASEDIRTSYGREYLDGMVSIKAGGTDSQEGTSKPVSEAIENAVLSKKAKSNYLVPGVSSFDWISVFARFYCFLPTWFSDRLIIRWTRCDSFPDYSAEKKEF